MAFYCKLDEEEIEGAEYRDAISEKNESIVRPGSAVIVFDGRLKPIYTAVVEGVYKREGADECTSWTKSPYYYKIHLPDGSTRMMRADRVSVPDGQKMLNYKAWLDAEKGLYDLAISSFHTATAVPLTR